MPALLLLYALLFASPGPFRADEDPPGSPDGPREEVLRVLAAWLEEGGRSHQALADALADLGGEASPFVCELLVGQRGDVPPEPLALAVGRVGHYEAGEALGRLLSSEQVRERLAAVEGLALLETRAGCALLVTAFQDPDASVRRRAQAALLSPHRPGDWVAEAVDDRILESPRPGRLARLLGRKGGEEARGVLLGLLDDWRAEIRLAGVLGLYLDPRAEDGPALIAVLARDDATAVRKQVCLVLGELRLREAVRPLIDALSEQDRGLTANAHWALARITGLRLGPHPLLWEQWWERGGKDSG